MDGLSEERKNELIGYRLGRVRVVEQHLHLAIRLCDLGLGHQHARLELKNRLLRLSLKQLGKHAVIGIVDQRMNSSPEVAQHGTLAKASAEYELNVLAKLDRATGPGNSAGGRVDTERVGRA